MYVATKIYSPLKCVTMYTSVASILDNEIGS